MHNIEEKVENDYFATQKDLKILSLELTNAFDSKINTFNIHLTNTINTMNENLNNKINKLTLDFNSKINKTKIFLLASLGTMIVAGFSILGFLIQHHQ